MSTNPDTATDRSVEDLKKEFESVAAELKEAKNRESTDSGTMRRNLAVTQTAARGRGESAFANSWNL